MNFLTTLSSRLLSHLSFKIQTFRSLGTSLTPCTFTFSIQFHSTDSNRYSCNMAVHRNVTFSGVVGHLRTTQNGVTRFHRSDTLNIILSHSRFTLIFYRPQNYSSTAVRMWLSWLHIQQNVLNCMEHVALTCRDSSRTDPRNINRVSEHRASDICSRQAVSRGVLKRGTLRRRSAPLGRIWHYVGICKNMTLSCRSGE